MKTSPPSRIFPHASKLKKVNCATCHEDVPKDLQRSVHARVTANPDGPDCISCHGSAHQHSSPVRPRLHGVQGEPRQHLRFLPHQSRFPGPAQDPLRAAGGGLSAERSRARGGRGQSRGGVVLRLPWRPRASFPRRNEAGKTNHWRVPETCATCHKDIAADLRGQRPWAGGHERGARRSGLHRLPRRARDCWPRASPTRWSTRRGFRA